MRSEERRLYWLAGAAAAALLGALWLAGALSAAVFGSGWRAPSLSGLVLSALRLPSHPSDPAAAWPRGVRGAMPGPAGFYASLALVSALLGGLAFAAQRAARHVDLPALLFGTERRRAPSARMARGRDLAPLRIASPQPGRLTLGHRGRTLLAAEERQSVIVFAPTQTFKTAGFVIPTLLEWEGPVLVTSVKNDLIGPTLAHRKNLGEVMIFDPAQTTKLPRSRATPLWGATGWRGAKRVAHWLMAAARISRSAGLQDADFWFATAEKLLAPLLFAAASDGRTISEVVRWLDEGPEASEGEVGRVLKEAGEPDAERAWQATLNREERQRSSVYTTAEMAMGAFGDPAVAEETAAADYTPASLLDGKANTLYLCAPRTEQGRLRPLFSMIVQELLAVVEELHATTGEPLDPPLLLLLDEAANIAPVPELDEIASTGAGQGVQLLSVFQDLAQVGIRYGRRAATIVNNHAAKVVGSGISDPETVNYFTRIVGAGEFEQLSRTSGERGRRSMTEGDVYRDLLPPSVLRETQPGRGLLVYKHLPAVEISLRPWFREGKLRKAAASGSAVKEVPE